MQLQPLVALSLDRFDGDPDSPRIAQMIGGVTGMLYAGVGRASADQLAFVEAGRDLALRCMVGMPAAQLKPALRVFFETLLCAHWRCSLRDLGAGLWREVEFPAQTWQPSNPRASGAYEPGGCLDTSWMVSLGIPRGVWEDEVLHSDGLFERSAKRRLSAGALARIAGLLAVYGFADPWQFFLPHESRCS